MTARGAVGPGSSRRSGCAPRRAAVQWPGMEPLKIYDYLTLARAKLFDWIRPLSVPNSTDGALVGLGTLGRTLTHVMICEWSYMERIQEHEVPPYEQWPIRDEEPPPFPDLQRHRTCRRNGPGAALAAVQDWTTPLQYQTDRPGRPIVTASWADIFTHSAARGASSGTGTTSSGNWGTRTHGTSTP